MKRKFTKAGKIAVSALSIIIISSQFMGCAATSKEETAETLKEDNAEQGEQRSIESIDWVELASLTNNPEIRDALDMFSGVQKTSDGKEGLFYINRKNENDNNNTLREALSSDYNSLSRIVNSKNGDNAFYTKALLSSAVADYYSDIDGVDFPDDSQFESYTVDNEAAYNTAFLAGLNAYFNLLPDYEPAYANMGSSLTRKEFMAMVFRADTPVQELKADTSFSSAVGETEYNLYAQNLQNNSYLDIESQSLDELTYNGTMTRAEAIYMLVLRYYADELSNIDTNLFTGYETEFTDAKDSGTTSTYERGTEHWKSNTLNDAIQNPDNGLPTEIFAALAIAAKHNIINIEDDTRWDEALTREDALQLLVNTYTAPSYVQNDIEIASEESVDFQTTQEKEDAQRQADIERYKQISPGQDTKDINSAAYQLGAQILNSRSQAEREADAADGYLGYDLKLGADELHYLVDILSGEEIHIGQRYDAGQMYQGEEGCKADKVYWYRSVHPDTTLTDDEIAALYNIY